MSELQQAANKRAEEESRLHTQYKDSITLADQDNTSQLATLVKQKLARRRALENEYAETKQQAAAKAQAAQEQIETELATRLAALDKLHADTQKAAEHQKNESQWEAMSLFDGVKDQPRQQLKEKLAYIDAQSRQVAGLSRDAGSLLALRRLTSAGERVSAETTSMEDDLAQIPEPTAALTATVTQLREQVLALQDQRTASLFLEGWRPVAWFLPSAVLAAIPSWLLAAGSIPLALLGTLGGGIALTLVVLAISMPLGRKKTLYAYQDILNKLQEAKLFEKQARATAQTACEQQETAHVVNRDHDLSQADRKCLQAITTSETQRNRQHETLTTDASTKLRELATQRKAAIDAADEKYPALLDQHAKDRQDAEEQLAKNHQEILRSAETDRDVAWEAMRVQWEEAYQRITSELTSANELCARLFPEWQDEDFGSWQRPTNLPGSMKFGSARLPMKTIRNGISSDERLQPPTDHLTLPALMTLDDQPNLLISSKGSARPQACEILQVQLLRFLTTAPAGKLRITAIDAAGLGENFSGFAHLADHHDQLMGKQIWTDSKDIAYQLRLVSDHIENVLQNYLRNDFATIHEYNEHAGEVAEPYRVIAVANFPEGFNEASAKRLENIAAAGPRCGVHVLLSIDEDLRLPHEFSLDPIRESSVQLQWCEDRFVWKYPLFERLPLQLDKLPNTDCLNEVLRQAGEASRVASKVEVPFSIIAPNRDNLWTSNSGRGLTAPIGRAGARQLQNLSLGRGTSQHVLISGKTGSGKSTLLHAMITNLAMHYGPDQLEFYLVDFKKGVEFAAYATGKLPHARVIAIESEREFGVSVLERLDEELRRRGELFRKHGVQDVAGLRSAAPEELLPRTVLIIDEFQELFVADDRLAQDAALLMDRLVRQGRAFGIHVILGSQSLSGAYSLARSTLGQMAVRIALECSEADANLILSDENGAARLLTRPGEAIYNDQNGFVAGNHTFQVAWLPDDQRRVYLTQLEAQDPQLAAQFEPAIVFEGNVAADPSSNKALSDTLRGYAVDTPGFWLGSSVRIEPPQRISLQRQSGANLAIVGGEEAMAVGMLTTAAISLAATASELPARLTIFDGTRVDAEEREQWKPIVDLFGERVEHVVPADGSAAMGQIYELLLARSKDSESHHASQFVVIHDLSQFRDLRLTEDEFSFANGGANKPPSPDKQFRQLLREGPAVGIHFLLWCESYNSLTRVIDRLTLREIDFRVAMQMSAADSTSLIDSPAAAQLGEHRALFYRDDLGTQTKFRPYGRPSQAWLVRVAADLQQSAEPAL
ncbi:FtsK/SpoIIIE domain-containing protein [Adhaeretor mobilis]|nr:FtsK/SpoIIIE domain-containing protein [Adhaeretor mobilis]